ncbi:MAG: hypothetical protein ACJAWA_000476 [Nonlabens sp.]
MILSEYLRLKITAETEIYLRALYIGLLNAMDK